VVHVHQCLVQVLTATPKPAMLLLAHKSVCSGVLGSPPSGVGITRISCMVPKGQHSLAQRVNPLKRAQLVITVGVPGSKLSLADDRPASCGIVLQKVHHQQMNGVNGARLWYCGVLWCGLVGWGGVGWGGVRSGGVGWGEAG
jgi:hypothetical protein